jgi:hypothetical protein
MAERKDAGGASVPTLPHEIGNVDIRATQKDAGGASAPTLPLVLSRPYGNGRNGSSMAMAEYFSNGY